MAYKEESKDDGNVFCSIRFELSGLGDLTESLRIQAARPPAIYVMDVVNTIFVIYRQNVIDISERERILQLKTL